MSDTPRTDAVAFGGNVIKSFEQGHAVLEQESQFVDAEHARQLERELHAMTLRCQAADRTANAALAARPEGGALVAAAALEEACIIALAISGHFSANPDEWLRGHETRLRELEKHARLRMNSGRT